MSEIFLQLYENFDFLSMNFFNYSLGGNRRRSFSFYLSKLSTVQIDVVLERLHGSVCPLLLEISPKVNRGTILEIRFVFFGVSFSYDEVSSKRCRNLTIVPMRSFIKPFFSTSSPIPFIVQASCCPTCAVCVRLRSLQKCTEDRQSSGALSTRRIEEKDFEVDVKMSVSKEQ